MGWSVEGLECVDTGTGVTDAPAWLHACADTAGGKTVVLRHGDVTLPLCLKKRHGLVIATCLGQQSRSDAGPQGSETRAMPPLAAQDLPGNVDLVDLRRFPALHRDSVLPECACRLTRPDIVRFSRPLEGAEEAFLATLSKGTRKDLRYIVNRVKKVFGQDNLRCRTVRLTEKNWAETFCQASTFARHTWQGQAGVSVLTAPGKQAFLFQLLRNAMPINMHFQHFGDAIAAVAITMEHNGTLLIYAHEYHMEQAKYQPGHILNYTIIMEAIQNGISRLDFGVGSTPHKYEWQCEPHELWRILAPVTWKGRLALTARKMRWRLGDLRKTPERT